MARVLIIGSSRGIGAEVTRQAADAGHSVLAMSRGGILPEGVTGDSEGISGDARNTADILRALDDVDLVVQTLGIPLSIKMILEPVTLFSESTRALIPLMKEAGVKRLISVTGFGAGDSHESISFIQRLPFQLVFQKAYDDKSIQEKLISESDLDWLIVRPGVLTNGIRSDQYKVLLENKDWRNGIISRSDVAAFIVSQFGENNYSRKKPVLIRHPL